MTANKKIMLVEDEEDIRSIAKISLEKIGHYSVKYCASGKEALEIVEDFKPDLIILDQTNREIFFVTIPVRFPSADDPQPGSNRICFLTHLL